MRRLFAVILIVTLWFGFAPFASAAIVGPPEESVAGLQPCAETPAFQQKAKNYRNTTDDPGIGKRRAEIYSQALCGPEGYPHLVADGRISHAGDFIIPSLLFLYIAGCIGWAGRDYIIATKKDKDPEMKEIIIDVPLAVRTMIASGFWPLAAVREYLAGTLTAKDSEIPVGPR